MQRAGFAIGAALIAVGFALPHLRRVLIADVVTWDAEPSEPAQLPVGAGRGLPPAGSAAEGRRGSIDGPGLAPTARTRVLLIDGLAADVAATLPAWTETCARGVAVTVDVGFPTVSLPVEVALWSGLTQQQTGVVGHQGRPLVPPLDRRAIPAQVAGSRALAENHGYIVRSLGFATAEPAAAADGLGDADLEHWAAQFEPRAIAAVASDAALVFVHILRVDNAGHRSGKDSDQYRDAAQRADALLARLVAAAGSDARWFLLSDHGHLPGGGHGGAERVIRQVAGCIVGPGLAPNAAHPVIHVVDIARAIADSVGAKLDPASRGRPLSVALRVPLVDDEALPSQPIVPAALAIVIVVLGAAAMAWASARWWLAAWWWLLACAALVVVRGVPTLSRPMIYSPEGRTMWLAWSPLLAVACVMTYVALGRTTLWRAVTAQLALPFAAAAAAITACGGWPAVFGAEVAPVVPHYTAWMSPLVLMAAQGAAAVGLAVLGKSCRQAIDRRGRPESPRTSRAGA